MNMFRMVYNDCAFEVLDQYRDHKITKQQALTKLNKLVDYVRNSEIENNRRDRQDHKERS